MDVATGAGDRFARGVLRTLGIATPYSGKDLSDAQRSELFEGAKQYARQTNVNMVGEPRLLYVGYGPGSSVQSALVGLGDGDGPDVLLTAARNAEGQLEFHLAEQDINVGVSDVPSEMNLLSAPTAEPSGRMVDDLERLADLKARGLITDQEFAAAKGKLLS